ncbi:MarR family winged helix-turn-helix transcriptional regulator [Subtercola frigoramans]|uniref:DNA-binding MarR family transcriptional regulator n=1 Tax=Subtercola frigoramans TaxID=120298 RepID=A0ABS2L9K6_9MICO|nr:MarR family winged helix-turn-helix transcriptional regulator [Subtercola frigoramans]MBM7473694.1 DNA-binding MarR family transcriptional regulator [Subtercola frigoramans]
MNAPKSHLPSDYTGFLFRRAQQAHAAAWQTEVSSEVTSVQYGVLLVLSRLPGASQTRLCEELDLDRSTIAHVVARLQRRGLLARSRDEADARRNVLALTTDGQRELARLEPRVERVDAVLNADLTDQEASDLRRLLRVVLDRGQRVP